MLSEYYDSFFNHNWLRDIRLIRPPKHALSSIKHFEGIPLNASFSIEDHQKNNVLNYRNMYGNCTAELTYYKDSYAFRANNSSQRFCSVIFLDFDTSNEEAKRLGKLLGNTKNKKAVQNEYRKLLVYTDILEKPFKGIKAIANKLKSKGINSYPVFSAGKGFHLYCWFPEQLINDFYNYKLAVQEWLYRIIEEVYLDNLDIVYPQVAVVKFLEVWSNRTDNQQVFRDFGIYETTLDPKPMRDSHGRVARLPYTVNEKTSLYCTPFSFDDSIEDILIKSAQEPVPEPINVDDYVSQALLEELMIVDIQLMLHKPKQSYAPIEYESTGKGNGKSNAKLPFSDLRVLVNFLAPETFAHNYNHYSAHYCEFHPDSRPSVIVTERKYNCQGCSATFGYFNYIKAHFGLKKDSEVKSKMKSIAKSWNRKDKVYKED